MLPPNLSHSTLSLSPSYPFLFLSVNDHVVITDLFVNLFFLSATYIYN